MSALASSALARPQALAWFDCLRKQVLTFIAEAAATNTNSKEKGIQRYHRYCAEVKQCNGKNRIHELQKYQVLMLQARSSGQAGACVLQKATT